MSPDALLSILVGLPLVAIGTHLLCLQYPRLTLTLQNIYTALWLAVTILIYLMISQRWVIFLGGWSPPYGITVVVDKPSALMLMVLALVSTAVSFYSTDDPDLPGKRSAYYIGFWLLSLGMTGVLLTHDIFDLYVFAEIMLVSAFITLCCANHPDFEAIFYYAVLNIFATLTMLLAIALIYAQAGTLNYSGLAGFFTGHIGPASMAGIMLLILGLGMKGGLFPLYFWLPKAYPATSYSTTMLLSSIVTKVVMFALLRLMMLWHVTSQPQAQWIMGAIAGATMFAGVMGAAYQYKVRSILSFHIVSQLGYVFFGVVMSGLWAFAAAVFFLIHNILVKTALFMISGIVERSHNTDNLADLGQVLKERPFLGAAFFLTAMSLAGIPPLSGFWGKLLIIKTGLSQHFFMTTAASLVVSLFTAYSMLKIWRYGFCENHATETIASTKVARKPLAALAPLVILPIIIGLAPDIVLKPLMSAGDQFGQSIALAHKELM